MRNIVLMLTSACIVFGCSTEQALKKLNTDKSEAESVFLTRDHHDNPVVVWTERSQDQLTLCFAVSNDNGKSFADKVSLPLTPDVATHPEGMPKLAFKSDGTIIAAYEKRAPTEENKRAGTVCYVTSRDGGKSWTREAFVHTDTAAGTSRSFFDLVRLPDGEIGASWLDIKLDEETGGRSVVFARTNGANVFSQAVVVDSSACQCCRTDLYCGVDGHIYLAYRGLRKGKMGGQIRDMLIATSLDGGKSFSRPIEISTDNWDIAGCPHTGPSLSSNAAGLFASWYTEGNGRGVYYARKSAEDDSFGKREALSAAGRRPQISANDNRVAVLWEETANDHGDSRLYYRLVEPGGNIQRGVLTPGEANAFYPAVTPAGRNFVVAFLMDDGDRTGAYVRKF